MDSINNTQNNSTNKNIISFLNQYHEKYTIKKNFISIPIEILDDLSSRFIINIPQDERGDIIRVLFQIELAHWFYVDFYCVEQPNLIKYNLKYFTKRMFQHVPFLKRYLEDFDKVVEKWRDYKHSVPTYGAIILDETMENVLMVQGFRSTSTWGFPKGKINAEEDPIVCACREVKEEIGFDCSQIIEKDEYIELYIRETFIRLYIVAGVSKNENFQPMTRNEIRNIQWFPLKNLPNSKNDIDFNPNAFFMVIPFIKLLKNWVYERRCQKSKINNQTKKDFFNSSKPKENGFKNSNIKTDIISNNFKNIKILEKPKNGIFWSKSLMKFNANLDELWNETIVSC